MNAEQTISRKTYLIVYVALLVLLGLTVAASFFNLGPLGVVIAVGIAMCKAVLILLYFMHVRVSNQLIWLAAGAAFLWLAIMMGLTLNDYISRDWLATPGV